MKSTKLRETREEAKRKTRIPMHNQARALPTKMASRASHARPLRDHKARTASARILKPKTGKVKKANLRVAVNRVIEMRRRRTMLANRTLAANRERNLAIDPINPLKTLKTRIEAKAKARDNQTRNRTNPLRTHKIRTAINRVKVKVKVNNNRHRLVKASNLPRRRAKIKIKIKVKARAVARDKAEGKPKTPINKIRTSPVPVVGAETQMDREDSSMLSKAEPAVAVASLGR